MILKKGSSKVRLPENVFGYSTYPPENPCNRPIQVIISSSLEWKEASFLSTRVKLKELRTVRCLDFDPCRLAARASWECGGSVVKTGTKEFE